MSEFIPLSEIDPTICSLPIPEGLEDQVGVNMRRLTSITALGCFASDKVRITSADGELSQQNVGIVGHDGSAAYAGLATSASAAKTAEFEVEEAAYGNKYLQFRSPAALTLRLNSTEIASNVNDQRNPGQWAEQTDAALRGGLNRAVLSNLVKSSPTAPEFNTGILTALMTANYLRHAPNVTLSEAVTLAYFHLGANIGQIIQVAQKRARLSEARLSFVPCFHVDRLAIAALRLKTTKLIKPLAT